MSEATNNKQKYHPENLLHLKCRAGDKTCPGQQAVKIQEFNPLDPIPGVYQQGKVIYKCITCERRFIL